MWRQAGPRLIATSEAVGSHTPCRRGPILPCICSYMPPPRSYESNRFLPSPFIPSVQSSIPIFRHAFFSTFFFPFFLLPSLLVDRTLLHYIFVCNFISFFPPPLSIFLLTSSCVYIHIILYIKYIYIYAYGSRLKSRRKTYNLDYKNDKDR